MSQFTVKKAAEKLSELKSLQYWEVKPGRRKLKLFYPPRHKRFAEAFRRMIEEWLKIGLIPKDTEVLLFPKPRQKH